MQKKLRITVEGKVYDVTVEDLTDPSQLATGYTSIPGTGGASVAVAPVAAPAATAAPASAAATAAAPGDQISPLSGVVDSISVSVGQPVKDGDIIAVVEAMKMKTQIYAHRDGTVTSIAVKPGEAVSAGHVLLTIG